MFTVYGEEYYNDFTRQTFTKRFNSLNDIYEHMKKISNNFADKYSNYFPTRKSGFSSKDFDWCGRISSGIVDSRYNDFWIYQIDNENGTVYSTGKYTNGERFCASSVEKWLEECEAKRKANKPNFVEC